MDHPKKSDWKKIKLRDPTIQSYEVLYLNDIVRKYIEGCDMPIIKINIIMRTSGLKQTLRITLRNVQLRAIKFI